MAIAEGEAPPGPTVRQKALIHPGIVQKVHVTLVRNRRVIAIDAVFHQQLPIGAHTVGLRAADDLHTDFRLVADQI